MEKSITITKRYTSAFALDRAKVSRILNIIEDKFAQSQDDLELEFEVVLSNGKTMNLTSVDEVLSLDNTAKNPVSSFIIEAHTSSSENSNRCKLSYDDSHRNNIILLVSSDEVKWADQLFAEVEEQIERTFLNSWIYRLKSNESATLSALLSSTLVAVTITAFIALVTPLSSNKGSSADVQALLTQAESAITIEEKVDFLFAYYKRELEQQIPVDTPDNSINFTTTIQQYLNLKNFFLVLPVIIIMGCLVYLYLGHYPFAVFQWGDYAVDYQELISRRKILWTVVIGALLIGIISSLFVFSISELV